ncbi:MAG: bifunctional farnesyl-diphosphate farnesyltransferase/squalene synthase [Chaenotheca gracillima]|nr:MAG: bifunctional farnesyl-diphosphate farnesyltransferase/squalene synthase [Chaenotheca gracillima]
MATTSTAPEGTGDVPIEANPDFSSETDSTLGDDESTYTASITSSIVNYPYENGRRYHAFKDGVYQLPNDDQEMDRLDLTHGMLRLILKNKLFLAPIGSKPQRILDIGTGTGIWAIEMADEFPSAEVIGTDLSPTQPTLVPPNVKFEVDDCEETWTFPQKFDLIHARYMAAGISDWPKLIKQTFDHVEPGGWAEFQDFDLLYYSDDGSLTEEHALRKWVVELLGAFEQIGKETKPGPKLAGWFRDAGFQNVTVHKYKCPIGPWPKDKELRTIGAWNSLAVGEGLEGFTVRLYTTLLGWKPEEVQVLLANVRKNLNDPKIHPQFDFYVVSGQKPEEPSAE